MSTMYDALKKAEAEKNKAAGIKVKTPGSGNPGGGKGISESTKIILLLVAVIAVFVQKLCSHSAKTGRAINNIVIVQFDIHCKSLRLLCL